MWEGLQPVVPATDGASGAAGVLAAGPDVDSPCGGFKDDGCFRSLLERARAAHDREVLRLRLEVQRLRQDLVPASAVKGAPRAPHDEPEPRAEPPSPTCPPLPLASPPCGEEMPPPRLSTRTSSSSQNMAEPLGRKLDGSSPGGIDHILKKMPTLGSSSSNTVGLEYTSRSRVNQAMLNQQKSFLWNLVRSPAFEVTSAVAIFANGVSMALEAQYRGFGLAEDTGHASANGSSAEVWPHGLAAFDALSWFFGVFFTVEVFLKIVALRVEFVHSAWNFVDLAVVLLWLGSVAVQSGVNLQFMRLARLARLIRLLRVLKFMHSHLTESLFLMTTALTDSVVTTGWSFFFLCMFHFLVALVINQGLSEYYFGSDAPMEDQLHVFQYFGSFSRAFLTTFEMTLGGWPNPVRVLVEYVHESFVIYAVVHQTVVGFAVIGILGAVFIQETFNVAHVDDNLMVRQMLRKETIHSEKMRRLFEEADVNGDGSIDVEEWAVVCQDEWVQIWLRAQELKTENAGKLFEMIDNGDGRLTAEELISGTRALKGPAAIISMLGLLHDLGRSIDDIRRELLFSQQAVASERM